VPAIFEAAFEHSGVCVRVDVLERLSRGYWGMREVKSSGEVKEHYYDDVAVQVYVLRKLGVRLSSVEIVHVNKNYVRGQKGVSLQKFFRRVEVRTEAKRRLEGIQTCKWPSRRKNFRAFTSLAARLLPPRHVRHGEATSGSQHARSGAIKAASILSIHIFLYGARHYLVA
jgi:hypothetical protein